MDVSGTLRAIFACCCKTITLGTKRQPSLVDGLEPQSMCQAVKRCGKNGTYLTWLPCGLW
eukprot:7188448-Karenia_brevis.AAC.1